MSKKTPSKEKIKKSRSGGVRLGLSDSWKCECGRVHSLDSYAAAHWNVRLIHACDCGRKHVIQDGWLEIEKDKAL